MDFEVKGRAAIVTGGTKGIGRGIANGLAAHGANIVVASRHQQDCARVAAEISAQYGVQAIGVAADVTSGAAIENLAAETEKAFGRIDILVNNAGSAVTKKAEDLTEEDWDRVLGLDLRAVFFCSQIIGRRMIGQKSGCIINIASALGLVGDKQVLPYAVAKSGVLQMTRCLALEWARHNIRVNAVCPGYVITELNEKQLSDEKIAAGLLRRFAIRRFAQVDEMSGAVVFLASDAASYMTGQSIVVDGGWTIQ